MKPHEFFDLTPHEVSEWIGPALEGQFGLGWRIDALRRMKRLPSRPSDLWKTKKALMTPAEMHRHMRHAIQDQRAQDSKEQQPKPRSLIGKTMREVRGFLKGKGK